jgi:hypothetical protein
MVLACENPADFGKNLFLHGARCFGPCGKKIVAALPIDGEVRVTAKRVTVGCPGTKTKCCKYVFCADCYKGVLTEHLHKMDCAAAEDVTGGKVRKTKRKRTPRRK